jgi:hypothetical protein
MAPPRRRTSVDDGASNSEPVGRISIVERNVLFGIVAAVLAIAAGLLYRNRLEDARREEPGALDDDLIRQIEQDGFIEIEEPLDLDHIREQEERFWGESWDEPDDG